MMHILQKTKDMRNMTMRSVWRVVLITAVLHILCYWSPSFTTAQEKQGDPQAWLRSSLPELQALATQFKDQTGSSTEDVAVMHHRFGHFFAIEKICRHIYGDNSWDLLGIDEKESFLYHFGLLLYHAVGEKGEDYGSERIIFVDELVKGVRAIVKTQVQGGQESASIVYYLRLVGGHWRIFDINIDGASPAYCRE